jgi:hypothetical protein
MLIARYSCSQSIRARQGMRQRQTGQADCFVGLSLQGLVDAIGAADDEGCRAPGTHPAGEALGQLQRRQIDAALVKDDHSLIALAVPPAGGLSRRRAVVRGFSSHAVPA